MDGEGKGCVKRTKGYDNGRRKDGGRGKDRGRGKDKTKKEHRKC